MDYEAIAKVNSEKEFAELLEKRWVWDTTPKLPQTQWINDWWKTILLDNEGFIWTPEWKTIVKDKITELPQSSTPK